ncbi:hypothetical protein [Pseudoscardovia suis]
MKCLECGREYKPTGHGKPQKYCSNACRQRAYKARKAAGKANASTKTAVTDRKPARPKAAAAEKADAVVPLSRLEFHRMMDDSMEDVLRLNRDVLSRALTSPDTPANALAAISRQLLAVTERLDRLEGGDPLLGIDAGDDTGTQNLTQEAGDAGKAVV